MQLTRAADYAVRVMIHLANANPSRRSSLSELAAAAEVSPAFLSKVLQRLVHSGLVASHRGKKGGFELLDRGRAASLYEVLQALDGVPDLNICLLPGGCNRTETCAAHAVWQDAQTKMREILSSATLENLACETRSLQKKRATGDCAAEVVG
jgi:Rrf2 family protein